MAHFYVLQIHELADYIFIPEHGFTTFDRNHPTYDMNSLWGIKHKYYYYI